MNECSFTGHCAKLWAIMKNSKVNKKASGKKWLVVVDDDTILRSVSRSVGRSVFPSSLFGRSVGLIFNKFSQILKTIEEKVLPLH